MKADRYVQVKFAPMLQRVREMDWRWLAVAVMAFGIVFRVAQYLANRSLWLDEVYLAQNIISRSVLELLHPLSDNQGAPLGFLLLERLAVQLGGSGEYALRFFPLLSGVASLFLFYRVAGRFLGRWGLVLALTFFAVSEPLIYFSSEVKQYSFDVLAALVIYHVVVRVQRLGLSPLNVILLAAVGLISVWFSDPAVFVLAAAGGTLALSFVARQEKPALFALGAVCLVWIVSFGLNYIVHLSNLSANVVLQDLWAGYFMPLPPVSLSDLNWFTRAASTTLSFHFQASSSALIGLTLVLGSLSAFSKRVLGLLGGPLVFALLASGLHGYPFYQRFLLFALPSLILLSAMGIEWAFNTLSGQIANLLVPLTLVGLVLFSPARDAFSALVTPRTHEEIRPVVEYLLKHRREEDGLYVYYSAERPLEYYLNQLGSHVSFGVAVNSRDDWMGYLEDLSRWRGKGRVWVLFSHVLRSEGVDEEKLFVQYLGHIGRQLDSFHRDGAAVYLYDLR